MPESLVIPADQNNRQLLGAFLRRRRESLDPNRLGLPRMRNRRTPGLRREEVAQLADVGVTWYTWLEQGRQVNASTKTLAAIAMALQCNEAETQHVFSLAGHSASVQTAARVCQKVSAHAQIMLNALNPFPAMVQTSRFDILGYNQAWRRLINIDIQAIPEHDRNCILLAFTHSGWRSSMLDWETLMPNMVAMFRSQMGENHEDPHWKSLLDRLLSNSEEFREIWQRYEIRGIDNQVKRFFHPNVGAMNLRQNNWWSAPRNGDRLLVYIPDDENSAEALAKLTGSDLSCSN
ncbi:helix-turn-helix transcriptional regulator [Acerihabitans sp. TG2]|uniref:helix-turn-helix transcriptional regulator n=1 Tax=Acerihabitans sp. TG2 TaxID=3096008 RepID=UPI002B230963|nr:helix-turn-helix transcriptional regulator [Acerihabitans sp. TG2]MEA9391504.1 helix-turn-helix transcriptional regulator [Acerihabitans sp. TG2]